MTLPRVVPPGDIRPNFRQLQVRPTVAENNYGELLFVCVMAGFIFGTFAYLVWQAVTR